MNKTMKIFWIIVLVLANTTCWEQMAKAESRQPSNETKDLEYSLSVFSKKVVAKNKVINMQYKRYGRQAVLSFDMIKPNEVLFMLYLLEYNDGDWRISKEYHYSKTIVPPSSASVC